MAKEITNVAKITDGITVEGGKLIKEISAENMQRRKTNLNNRITVANERISDLNKEKTELDNLVITLTAEIAKIDALLGQL